MFKTARIKLTIWYLLIIMAISISFSAIIYIGTSKEIDRALRFQVFRTQHPQSRLVIIQKAPWDQDDFPLPPAPDTQVLDQSKLRVLLSLFEINFIILLFSAFAGYFLAGRTLRPIKEMLDEQSRFVADASHELNTPLTSLKTSIEVNLRDKDFDLRKAKELLLSNLEDVNNLQILSSSLINLNKYQNKKSNITFKKLLLSDILEKAKEKVKSQAKLKKINININSSKFYINADEKSLTELFIILLDNAIKYSNSGKKVLIDVKKTDQKVQIIIEDQGIGIEKENLPFIFDRFYRAEESRTKNDYMGYGLGLSIAKRIVTLHNGLISAESKIGKGSKFIILLNLA